MTFRIAQSRLPRALDRYRDQTGVRARKAIVDELQRGLRRGDSPVTVARRIRKRVESVVLARALTIARTEMMTALWTSTQRDFERDPFVTGWQWMARLDGHTCVVCRAMHGTRHSKAERLQSHPNCRCAMSPIVAGVEAIPASESGEAMFRRLPAAEKRRILGPERYAAYRETRSLGAFVERTSSPTWGGGRRVVPVSRVTRRRAA